LEIAQNALIERGITLRSDIIVICHGGPLDEPNNVGNVLAKMPGSAGFLGASSTERLPTERAIRGQIEAFKKTKDHLKCSLWSFSSFRITRFIAQIQMNLGRVHRKKEISPYLNFLRSRITEQKYRLVV
jgi:hypothetical protein